jgi:ABC-type transport system involved in multi-copper enzyme maturation permease subunit
VNMSMGSVNDIFSLSSGGFPSYYTSETMYAVLLIWISIPLVLTFFIFQKKDI